MTRGYVATASTVIHAPVAKVWQALTDREMIRQYLFGTEVTSDWQAGSSITYRGVWEGKAYEDKGTILQIEPEKLLVSNFWSALSGKPDAPEHYDLVRYELAPDDGGTRLTITQDNNASQQEADHSQQNWGMVLDGLKKLLEQ